jgi:exosortase J
LPYPWLQHHAKRADYLIGGCLFLCALAVFFTVANRLRREPQDVLPAITAESAPASHWAPPLLARVAAVLVLAAIFGADVLHERRAAPTAQALPPLPQRIGDFTLVRTWQDTLADGIVVYLWGEYAGPADTPGAPVAHISLGIAPELGVHDAEVCHIARGEDPTWHGQIEASSAHGNVELTAATYNNGAVQRLEASTVCDGGLCRQYSESSRHVTLVYARPHRGVPLQADTARPVPVLLTVEDLDVLAPTSTAESRMSAQLTQFLRGADLAAVTAPYGRR